jgi:hypothetical protein
MIDMIAGYLVLRLMKHAWLLEFNGATSDNQSNPCCAAYLANNFVICKIFNLSDKICRMDD